MNMHEGTRDRLVLCGQAAVTALELGDDNNSPANVREMIEVHKSALRAIATMAVQDMATKLGGRVLHTIEMLARQALASPDRNVPVDKPGMPDEPVGDASLFDRPTCPGVWIRANTPVIVVLEESNEPGARMFLMATFPSGVRVLIDGLSRGGWRQMA